MNNSVRRFLAVGLAGCAATALAVAPVRASTRVAASTPAARKAPPAFPAIAVTNISDGKAFNLRSLATSNRAVLIWFWAPS
jgi:hypothetical protein